MDDRGPWSAFNMTTLTPFEDLNETLLLDSQSPSLGNSSEEEYLPYHLRPETYLVPLVFAGIFVTGVVGNGALIFMFLKHPKLRLVT